MALEIQTSKLFADLALVVFFAVAGGLLAARLRQPPVIGLLLVGALVGPNALGLVGAQSIISAFAQIGAVLLLFMIGVEFSIPKLFEIGLRAVVVAVLKMSVVFFALYELALLLGLSPTAAIYAGAIFAISSTAILAKLLEQQGLKSHPAVSLLVGELVIEDVIAVLALTFFASASVGGHSLSGVVFSLVLALVVLGISYLLLRRVLERVLAVLERYPTPEFLTFAGLGACLAMSLVAGWLGLTPAIGAFLAGSIVSSLPSGQRIEEAMRPFGLTFSSLFFVSVGMLINPATALGSLPIGLALIAVFLVVTFVIVSLLVRLSGSSGRDAAFSGVAMLTIGEFSLLIAQQGAPHVSGVDLVGVASLGVLITSAVCAFALPRHARLYSAIDRVLPRVVHRRLQGFSDYWSGLLSEFERGGEFHRVVNRQARSVLPELTQLVLLGAAFLVMRVLLRDAALTLLGFQLRFVWIIGLVLLILAIYPLWRVGRASETAVDALSHAFLRIGLARSERGRLMAELLLAALFLLVGLNLPVLLVFLRLPSFFTLLPYAFVLLGLLFALDAGRILYRHGRLPHHWR